MNQVRSLLARRVHLRFILAVLVTALLSMTLHHPAMAAPVAATGHIHAVPAPSDCSFPCEQDSHGLPLCCGMGLCVSGLPASPLSFQAAVRRTALVPRPEAIAALWIPTRIDRPPKSFSATASPL